MECRKMLRKRTKAMNKYVCIVLIAMFFIYPTAHAAPGLSGQDADADIMIQKLVHF
jgi:hypothetical protein